MKSQWTFETDEQEAYDAIVDLEEVLEQTQTESLIQELLAERERRIQECICYVKKDLEEIFGIQVPSINSSQDIPNLFAQRFEQQELQKRYQSKSFEACLRYHLEEIQPPYDLKTIENIEKSIEKQEKLHQRLTELTTQAKRLDVGIPELEQPLQEVDIVEQENRISVIQDIHDEHRKIQDLGYHDKTIDPMRYSKTYLRQLQQEYQTQLHLLDRYNRYKIEFERLGLEVENRKFPLQEADIKMLEDNIEYQSRWAQQFFEIKQNLWNYQRKTMHFPKVPYTEEEVIAFLGKHKKTYQQNLKQRTLLFYFSCLLFVGIITAVLVWRHHLLQQKKEQQLVVLALEFEYHQGYSESPEELQKRWDDLCHQNIAQACKWKEKRSQIHSEQEGILFWQDLCEREGDAVGCLVDGWYWTQTQLNGINSIYGKDIKKGYQKLYQACTQENLRACVEITRAPQGHPYKISLQRQFSILQSTCDGGNLRGCNNLGLMYKNGEGVVMDKEKAVELYKKACDGGNLKGCNNLGWMYENGEGVVADKEKAVVLYKKACDGGNMYGCSNLGVMYENGEGVVSDKEKAVELYKKACDGRNRYGCNNLGVMYKNGEGVVSDKEKAAELYKKACDGGNMYGCNNLGWMYENGEGVVADKEKAAELYKKACDGGNMMGCNNLEIDTPICVVQVSLWIDETEIISGIVDRFIPKGNLYLGFGGGAACCEDTDIFVDHITIDNVEQPSRQINFSNKEHWYRAGGCYQCDVSGGVRNERLEMHSDWNVISSDVVVPLSTQTTIKFDASWSSNVSAMSLRLGQWSPTSSCNSCCPSPACNDTWIQVGINPMEGNAFIMKEHQGVVPANLKTSQTVHKFEVKISSSKSCFP